MQQRQQHFMQLVMLQLNKETSGAPKGFQANRNNQGGNVQSTAMQ